MLDSFDRTFVWSIILLKLGKPARIFDVIRSIDGGSHAKVCISDELADPFKITYGFRQGCILVPTLFIMLFSYVLRHAHK